MACKCKKPPAAAMLAHRRALIQAMFDGGKPAAALRHRWDKCAHASEAGLACDHLWIADGQAPACIDPQTNHVYAAHLYAALQRPNFGCAVGYF